MGFWDFMSGSTPVGIVSDAGQKVVTGVFDGIAELVKTIHLAPEDELKFKIGLAQVQLQTQQGLLGDIDSARKMQIATKSWIPGFLAIGITFGFFGLLTFLFTHSVPPENKDILNIMLGALGTAWIMVVTFYFGSSQGSESKTTMLHDMARANGK